MFTLFRYLFKLATYKPEYTVCIIGFQQTGKTSIYNELCRLYDEKGVQLPLCPTLSPNEGYLRLENMNIRLFDLPGDASQRESWSHFLVQTNAILFVVDGSLKGDHWDECSFVLSQIMSRRELQTIPLAVCVNKYDLVGKLALDVAEQRLGLHRREGSRNTPIFFTTASTESGSFKHLGLDPVLSWLRNTIPR
eukprot:TRINITY_DN9043_c0_g1_i2.p1 TRINITY_DN9043_c0_g1~~TRINITY_DN9043_c0_g1_i2.p1  ORF type:complete len:193 (+),score=38.68 TRINITY_DN9043_c0_g1_i2:44-622(+)